MGMDEISKQLPFILTGLSSNVCSIELGEIRIVESVSSSLIDLFDYLNLSFHRFLPFPDHLGYSRGKLHDVWLY
jgi:hypothetical protein